MQSDLTFAELRPEHLSQVESWADGRQATGALLKLPFIDISNTSDTQGWVALHDSEVLALATMQLDSDHIGNLYFIVKPDVRRHGLGTQLVEYVLGQPSIKSLVHLHAAVDQANTAAQKILERHGFSRSGYSPDGLIEFAWHKN